MDEVNQSGHAFKCNSRTTTPLSHVAVDGDYTDMHRQETDCIVPANISISYFTSNIHTLAAVLLYHK